MLTPVRVSNGAEIASLKSIHSRCPICGGRLQLSNVFKNWLDCGGDGDGRDCGSGWQLMPVDSSCKTPAEYAEWVAQNPAWHGEVAHVA